MLWRSCVSVAVLICVSCGDDGVGRLPDAPRVPDAPVDGQPIDAVPDAPAMLTTAATFATGLGTLCGIAYDHVDTQIWVYPCDGANLTRFSPAGTVLGTLARPGEVANDVDVDIAPVALTLGVTAVAAGDLIVINGETIATAVLVTTFGASHVVGGAYHSARRLAVEPLRADGGHCVAKHATPVPEVLKHVVARARR